MFTRDFKKLGLLLAAAGAVLALYALLTGGLLGLSHAVERTHDVYPFRHEDYLRLLLPTLHEGKGSNRILLAGGSDARETFLYERFDRAFPDMKAFQGGTSLETFSDLLLSLEYTEQAHGRGALPRVLVLGIIPRFVANIPRGESPLVGAIDRYSPEFRVETGPGGARLVPKDWREGLRSRLRFLGKQQARYRTALAALHVSSLPDSYWSNKLKRLAEVQLGPYKYHHLPSFSPDEIRSWLNDPESFWHKTHVWDPADEAEMVREEFARLLKFTRQRDIRLYVVNLPEVVWNRELYRPEYYAAYERLVRESLGDTPFLDLRDFLGPEEFYDAGHPTLPGAVRVTDRVIEFLKDEAAAGQGW